METRMETDENLTAGSAYNTFMGRWSRAAARNQLTIFKMKYFICPALLFLSLITSFNCLANTSVVRVNSPNGQVRIELLLQRYGEAESVPHWRVYFKNKPIVLASRLSID